MTTRTKKFCCCASCLSELLPDEKFIDCSRATCQKRYHIDIICSGGAVPAADQVSNWICPACACQEKRGGDNSSTPVRYMETPDANITLRQKKNQFPSDFKVLTGEIRSLREDMIGFKGNMEILMATTVTRFEERVEELLSRLAVTDERINALKTGYEAENALLRQQVSSLEGQLRSQAQASLRNQIEIVGLPETPTENLCHIALVSAKKVGVDMTQEDIDWIERAGPKRKITRPDGDSRPGNLTDLLPRPIVLRFTRRVRRDDFLKAAKSRKLLTADQLGVGDQPIKVFFNERLTRENRLLFRETRKRAAEAGFKFCWTSNGYINIRRREGSPAIQIRSIEELTVKLCGSNTTSGTWSGTPTKLGP